MRYEDDYRHHKAWRGSYEDKDPGQPRRSGVHYNDESDRQDRRVKRPRTHSRARSRSPYRHSHRQDRTAKDHKDNGVSGNEQSVSARGRPSSVAQDKRTNAETRAIQTSDPDTKSTLTFQADKYVQPKVRLTDSDVASVFQKSRSTVDAKAVKEPAVGPDQQPMDEMSLIEERRKRREAIKAKYRGSATPLLVQALHLDTDEKFAGSNLNVTQSLSTRSGKVDVCQSRDGPLNQAESPGPTSPQTPKDTPGLQSPTELNFVEDEDLVNNNADTSMDHEDEPSAADYDPTIDMQEERARHDKRLFNEDTSSSAYDGKKALDKDVVEAAARQDAEPAMKPKETFDMFAEDDDDELDMFVKAPQKVVKPAAPESKAAQALNVNLMDNWDDPEGYYTTILGELIQGRYHVHQNLGRGMFSSVVRASDTTTSRVVAIKIVRNNDTMRKAGIKEIEILKDLAANDPEDKKHIIRLDRSFEHKGHLCMVFENLSLNLREVLKKFGRDVGINLKAIRAYAQQIFLGLSLLKKCQYLHADLKPDNILVNDSRNLLKICDLGSASSVTENVTAPYLVSRFYRAPEIILGIPYDYGIDVWSIGCTLFELYTGRILFTGRNNNAMLRSIMECRGKFPHKLLRKGSLSCHYFDNLLNFQAVEEDKLTGRGVTKMLEIKAKPVRDLRSRLVPKGKRLDEIEKKESELFLDLLDKCLDLRPDKRITPHEALKHPFIMRIKA